MGKQELKLNSRKFWPAAVAEYVVGLYASGMLGRVVAPLVAVAFTGAFLVGLCDTASGWRLSLPLWAHVVSTLAFAVGVFVIVAGHIRRTREIGRQFLNRSGGA